MTTFWELWREQLPGAFDKTQAIENLKEFWGISQNAAYCRMRSGRWTVSDLRFFWECLGIGFSVEKGFFLDFSKYQQVSNERALNMYGLRA